MAVLTSADRHSESSRHSAAIHIEYKFKQNIQLQPSTTTIRKYMLRMIVAAARGDFL